MEVQMSTTVTPSLGGGSNRIAAVNITTPTNAVNLQNHQEEKNTTHQKPGWRKFVSHVGPGFLVSLAYLDPGNLETDLQAGANHGFELLWVVLIGLIFALIIQSLAANLGAKRSFGMKKKLRTTKVSLSFTLFILRLVIGTAFALNILFHIPVWAGVLLTGLSTLLLLGLQRYGARKLELLIAILVFVMAACFFGEMSYVKPPASGVLKGMFVPKLKGEGATADAIALLGALVMPHNLFLHSALVLSRKVPNSVRGINDACRYFLIESGIALFIAFLINVAVVSVSGTVCTVGNVAQTTADQCSDITLNSASFLLQNVLGKSSSTIYAIALFASGQSSSITGTYAGIFGLENENMGKKSNDKMILSFELPFALIPLLKFSSSSTKMGPHKNSIYIIVISWILGLAIIGINIYYLSTAFVDWLIHNNLHKVANVFIGIAVFPLMAAYIGAVIYLMFRKDRVVTYIEPEKDDAMAQAHLETGLNNSFGPRDVTPVPFREDLAHIQLPE
ncbi:metal transporter Nramp5-like [Cucumis melo var. makuwa]|uniref:Metal transporter Nramp5-like n=1 Tax=Cucumis melo var. makuwa TaxID=1194695 RepID=A0A5D3C556_CUCMM|nr:metal transporter Nramp5-like [Cucumis melo var. makuwa]